MIAVATAHCPLCATPLGVETDSSQCPGCRSELEVKVFSAGATQATAIASAIAVAGEDDARCRFLPELKAETVCDGCGALMSEKAAAHWGAKVFCLPCVNRLRKSDAADREGGGLLGELRIYDNLALLMVSLLSPLSLMTAPVALYLLLRYRKAPRGLVPRGPLRWWLALLVSVAALVMWLGLLGMGLSVMIDSLTN